MCGHGVDAEEEERTWEGKRGEERVEAIIGEWGERPRKARSARTAAVMKLGRDEVGLFAATRWGC